MKDPDTERLRLLVGTTFRNGEEIFRLIEVLDDSESVTLVFEPVGAPATIQRDQFGEPARLAPRLLSIALYEDGRTPNPLLQDFEPPLF